MNANKQIASIECTITIVMSLLLIAGLLSACSGINIQAARNLSATGKNVALQVRQNIFVSDDEYTRARDGEALVHGFSGTTNSDLYAKILKDYDVIHQELAKRTIVFESLADVYDAFGELAGLDAGAQTEQALTNLGGAIEEYAKQIMQPSPIYKDTTAIISKVGGIVAAEIQKAKIKEASIQIRGRVEDFQKLLGNKLVREQMTGFRQSLTTVKKAAFTLMWNQGVYDPKPLLDDFGTDAGLVAKKEAAAGIKPNTPLGNALLEVLKKRLAIKADLIEKSYDASLKALGSLISEHRKLEQGEPLDLNRVQAISAELRSIAGMLTKVKADLSKNQ
ncbi:MAG: hypothetical protein OS130_05820 [Thermodesulfobacteriota bacterium]|jgi:hypothetical protein|nr:MAG: hypothetical protein OS130_05820 [Thermodesulfobacteriota bacterium]